MHILGSMVLDIEELFHFVVVQKQVLLVGQGQQLGRLEIQKVPLNDDVLPPLNHPRRHHQRHRRRS